MLRQRLYLQVLLLSGLGLASCSGEVAEPPSSRTNEGQSEGADHSGESPDGQVPHTGAPPVMERNPADGNRPAWGEFSASFTENVHGGNGWAWVATLGGSPRDFPGSGGVIAPEVGSLAPAATTLVTSDASLLKRWSQIPEFCNGARAAHSKGAALAVRLPALELEINRKVPTGRSSDEFWNSDCPGCPGAPTQEDLARREDDSSLERHATAGSSLLLLETPRDGSKFWSPGLLRQKLLRTVFRPPHPDWSILRLGREAARRFGQELHLGAALPASIGRDNFWPVAGMLDLVSVVPREGEELDPWRSLAINRVLRARGKRPLLQIRDLPGLSEGQLLQQVALNLVSGGTVLVDSPEHVPSVVRSALELAQKHPEFFFLRAGRVGLYYSLASMSNSEAGGESDPYGDGLTARDFFGLGRLLDELHIPYKVIFAGDGISVDNAFESERLGLYDAVLLPRSKRLSEVEHQALLEMGQVGAVVLSGPSGSQDLRGRGVSRNPLTSAEGRRFYELEQSGAQYLSDPSAARREALAAQLETALSVMSTTLSARVKTALPESVIIERVVDPRTSMLVHHFVNVGDVDSKGHVPTTEPSWLRVPAWPRRADLNYEVRLYSPSQPDGVDLGYRWLAESSELEVQLPGLEVWSVLTVRPRLSQLANHQAPVTIEEPAFDPGSEDRESRQISFDVPAWDGGRRKLTLRAPEDVISASSISGLGEGLRAEWSRAKDGSKAVLKAQNEHVSVQVEVAVEGDFIDVNTRIENLGKKVLERVEAMFCLDPGDLHLFPDSGLDRNYLVRDGTATSLGSDRHGSGTPNFSEGTAFDLPMTVLESVDGRWSLGHAFEQTEILGANGSGGGVCIHTRPRFGDLAVGGGATRKGRIYLARGRAEQLFDRLRSDKPFPMASPTARQEKPQHPCLTTP